MRIIGFLMLTAMALADDKITPTSMTVKGTGALYSIAHNGSTAIAGSEKAVGLTPTKEGGLIISQGIGGGSILAEVKPDGSIIGDPVKALQALANAMQESTKRMHEYEK